VLSPLPPLVHELLLCTLPHPSLPTAPAVILNEDQNVNGNQNQKGVLSPLLPLVHELQLCTLSHPSLSTAPAVILNENQNVNGN